MNKLFEILRKPLSRVILVSSLIASPFVFPSRVDARDENNRVDISLSLGMQRGNEFAFRDLYGNIALLKLGSEWNINQNARLEAGISYSSPKSLINGSYDLEATIWQYDLIGHLLLPSKDNLAIPYIGAGWSFVNYKEKLEGRSKDFKSEGSGLNLVAGVDVPYKSVVLFLEVARNSADISDGSTTIDVGGLRIHFGVRF